MELPALIDGLATPWGLVFSAFFTLMTAGIWRVLLGSHFQETGWGPLYAGLILVLMSVFCCAIVYVGLQFSERPMTVQSDWSETPALVIGTSLAFYLISLPLLWIMFLPVMVYMLRKRLLAIGRLAKIGAFLWIILSVLLAALPSNEWARSHVFASFALNQAVVLPIFIFVYVPFICGMYYSIRRKLTIS